jgi:hypothetical protein
VAPRLPERKESPLEAGLPPRWRPHAGIPKFGRSLLKFVLSEQY